MADYSVQMIVSLHVEDTLVGYEPPFGTLPESMRAFAASPIEPSKIL
jgi:hypothetical protein